VNVEPVNVPSRVPLDAVEPEPEGVVLPEVGADPVVGAFVEAVANGIEELLEPLACSR
jgi:hypothetical protein